MVNRNLWFLIVLLSSILQANAADQVGSVCQRSSTSIPVELAIEYLSQSRETDQPVVREIKISNGIWTVQDEKAYQVDVKSLNLTKNLLVALGWKNKIKSWFSYSETASPLTWK